MDNSDYQDADAIPLNPPIPSSHYIPEEVGMFILMLYVYYC